MHLLPRSADRQELGMLANHGLLTVLTICSLYKSRWQAGRAIKRDLRIKRFYNTSENAAKTEVWITVPVHALVTMIGQELGSNASCNTLLQIPSVTLFERASLQQTLAELLDDA